MQDGVIEILPFGLHQEKMMFGFEPEEAKVLGSWGRFYARIEKFRAAGKTFPVLQHHCWWLFHNCIAHMLIGLIPHKSTFWLHDWTSRKLNAE